MCMRLTEAWGWLVILQTGQSQQSGSLFARSGNFCMMLLNVTDIDRDALTSWLMWFCSISKTFSRDGSNYLTEYLEYLVLVHVHVTVEDNSEPNRYYWSLAKDECWSMSKLWDNWNPAPNAGVDEIDRKKKNIVNTCPLTLEILHNETKQLIIW